MIQKDFYETRKDGVNLYRSYSDLGVKIYLKNNPSKIYDDAIDPETSKNEYEETDIPIIIHIEEH